MFLKKVIQKLDDSQYAPARASDLATSASGLTVMVYTILRVSEGDLSGSFPWWMRLILGLCLIAYAIMFVLDWRKVDLRLVTGAQSSRMIAPVLVPLHDDKVQEVVARYVRTDDGFAMTLSTVSKAGLRKERTNDDTRD